MGLGSLLAAVSAAKTAASAASAAKKNSGKTSTSGSSSGSSGNRTSGSSSGSSGGSYTPIGSHNDATIRNNSAEQTAQLQKYKDDYAAAAAKGDKAGMDAAHKNAEALRSGWGYSGGEDGSDYI